MRWDRLFIRRTDLRVNYITDLPHSYSLSLDGIEGGEHDDGRPERES